MKWKKKSLSTNVRMIGHQRANLSLAPELSQNGVKRETWQYSILETQEDVFMAWKQTKNPSAWHRKHGS